MVQDNDHRNAGSRKRLRDLVDRLDDADLLRQVDDDWTVGAILAHLAFWDQSCVARWEAFDREGAFVGLPGEVVDLLNRASLPAWRAMPGSVVKSLVLQAAEDADARTEHLSQAARDYVNETGRTFILERWEHRNEHLNEIERFLVS